ncbi:hypothetical protein TSUD_276920 [Trifolium subterraneum]|uniref:Reverse transcriptase domain-containing protein n=1 Tax=Trifolium subterraneum TaxID=3900 RepID=A0A2Z6NQ45_TRISU|nr:hypothetical protein TSUD_276920 [Trifolium subterraneum]
MSRVTKARIKSNLIPVLRVDGEWIESPPLIKEAVSSYFRSHVSSPYRVKPRLDGVFFNTLSEEENAGLISPFSLEEIQEVVANSDGSKSPGPDGFNFSFLKKFWELLKGDIRIMFDQFHGNSCLPKSLLFYFVTLIPKVSSPCSLADFRPISLLSCLYKLIAKVLAKRLALVMDSVIASNQSTFIKGRNLVDGVLIVNEVVELAKKTKKECLIFKVDFEKAYDSVDWGFLEYMLRRCGFCEKWIHWIRACVFAGNLSVLVNGSPTPEINIQRGLKQGDTLAPFLFLLVVEGLSGVMRKRLGSVPFTYLGLPIGANPRSLSTWEPLVDLLRKRLNSWRNKYISLGGQIVMINAVLNAIPIFYLSFLKMPKKVWRKVVRIQREFLWGGVRGGKKVSWVRWSVVCKEKDKGGLGVRDIRLVNISLLSKWRWRLLLPGRSLWKDVLVSIYGDQILHRVDWSSFSIPYKASNWWKDICSLENVVEAKNWLAESISRRVGDGSSTSFWATRWIGEAPLAVVFPRLFSLSNQQGATVKDLCEQRGGTRTWNFSWRRNLFQWEEGIVTRLQELVDLVILSREEDRWWWRPDPDGEFSVNSSYKFLIGEFRLDVDAARIFGQLWESPAPSKVIAFSWQLLYDRIPTRRNLEVRGILGRDTPWECLGCVGMVESSLHLFLHCLSAMMMWYEVFRWLGVIIVIPPSLFLLFELMRGSTKNVKIQKGFVMI